MIYKYQNLLLIWINKFLLLTKISIKIKKKLLQNVYKYFNKINNYFMIHGPPGTGKTHTITEFIRVAIL